MFEDVEACKRVNKKYDEGFIKDSRSFIENETFLLELALNVSSLYEYKIKYEIKVFWNLYCFGYIEKNRETFEEKFRKHSNLADNLDNETENFIKNCLEYEDDVFVRVDGANLYSSCFANRYIRVKCDSEYGFSENEAGVYMNDVHYPWLVFK